MHAAPMNGAQMHTAPMNGAPMHAQGAHPQGVPGAMPGRGPDARFARGAIRPHDFGGHAYRGRVAWEGGRWRHEVHNGRDGWWWDVGGVWYYYPQPIDGPPAYISEDYADDVVYADEPPVAAAAYPPPPPGAPPPPPDPAASAVGGATGAIAGATAAARPGYYLAEGNCYYRYPSGSYVLADPRWCY